jgi:hypothetical protein
MAAGVYTSGYGQVVQVPDNSCAGVTGPINAWHQANGYYYWSVTSCSSDLVVVGTVINFVDSRSGALGRWDTQSITATPSAPSGTATGLQCDTGTSGTQCVPASLDKLGINSEQMLYAFGWGFGAVLLGFVLGYVLGSFVGLLKKA